MWVWGQFAPRSFYDSFLLSGHRWVSGLGPYNEHLIRDVGAACLALLVISVWAVLRPGAEVLGLVSLDDTVSYALLVVLETPTPAERTAWVLHDLFGMPFSTVAETVGRTPAAVRQLAARARAHVNARAPRVTVSAAEHTTAVNRFLNAAVGGDLAALIETLDPDVVLTSDGGGQVTAARRPVHGARNVARLLRGLAAKARPTERLELLRVNDTDRLGIYDRDELTAVVALTVSGGRISRVDMIRAPTKLPPQRLRLRKGQRHTSSRGTAGRSSSA